MTTLPQLDPNERGNEHLHSLLRRVHPDDVDAFVEKLTTQPLRDRFHTYRELLLGVHLRDQGFDERYEHEVGEQKPDWCLIEKSGEVKEVLDVFTLHQRHEKDLEITSSIKTSQRWSGWITVPPDHIYRKLTDKAGQYSKLARYANMPFVIAVYGEFTADVTPNEMHHILFEQHEGWFTSAPEVSGVIYFRERFLQFEYTYYSNPHAANPSTLLA